jgi:nicotinamidase-related amidase
MISLNTTQSLLLIIDLQPRFLGSIFESERVIQRSIFLAKCASLLGVPVFATEQNVERMGGTDAMFEPHITNRFAKMEFSAAKNSATLEAIWQSGRKKIVIVGIETHICVGQTAQDLINLGFEVAVCPDAVSASTQDRHKLGMERIRDAGVVPVHTEAVVYEWMGTATNPNFREALQLVKDSQMTIKVVS